MAGGFIILVLLALLGFMLTILAKSNRIAEEVPMPGSIPQAYITEVDVYQSYRPETASFEIRLSDEVPVNRYESCWSFSSESINSEGSGDVKLLYSYSSITHSSGVQIRCDASLSEMLSSGYGPVPVIDILRASREGSMTEMFPRSFGVYDVEQQPEELTGFARSLDTNGQGHSIVYADVPITIQNDLFCSDKWLLPLSFYVQGDTFSQDVVKQWGHVRYQYQLRCLDDECATVEIILNEE